MGYNIDRCKCFSWLDLLRWRYLGILSLNFEMKQQQAFSGMSDGEY